MKTAELARTTFSVLVIGALIVASLWVLRPFLGSTIWAAMAVVTTWPVLLRVQARLGGRRAPAVAVMTLLLLLLFAVPLVLTLATIVDNADRLVDWAKSLSDLRLPPAPPEWLSGLPMVGDRITELWTQAVDSGVDGLLGRLKPYAGNATRWFVGQVGGLGYVLVQFFFTVAIAGVMYAHGEPAAAMVRRFAYRVGGVRGEAAVKLAQIGRAHV